MGEGTVLYRRSALGDVVLLGAVTSRVPGPVTVVTAPEWTSVAARLRGVDRVIPWHKGVDPRTIEVPPGIRVDLQGGWRSLGLGRAIDKRSVRRRVRLWFGVGAPRPAVVRLYGEACGVEPAAGPWIDVDGPRDRLVLAPGAAWATKRWSRFAEAGRAFGGPVTVIGGPGEEDLCQAVADGIPGAEVLCERGFDRTVEALGRARVVIANDSGLMHLAGACGAPVVAIFGSTHPDDGFWCWPGEVAQRDLSCRPCTLHGRAACPLGDAACLDVAVEAVLAAARRVAS